MKWTTAVSQHEEALSAFRQAREGLEMRAEQVDVLLVFFSDYHTAQAQDLALAMVQAFPSAVCIGCNAAGVIGSSKLASSGASLSVTAGVLPGVKIQPLRFEAGVHDQSEVDWREELESAHGQEPHFLLLAQAMGFEAQALLGALDRSFPMSSKFGALIDVPAKAGGNQLILEGHVYQDAAIGLALSGNIRVDTLVAQSCKPIGAPMIVTSRTRNIIHRFDRGNPMEVFVDAVAELSPREQKLAHERMFVGIGVENRHAVYQAGDYLVRNIIGFNRTSGDLAVAAPLKDHAIVQFHLMDPVSADGEFDQLLSDFAGALSLNSAPQGALLFSGNGHNGERSDQALKEMDALRRHFKEICPGGIFSEGEIAPIGRTSCIHGYASSVTLFREA